MNAELLKNARATFYELNQVLSDFRQEQVNKVPFEGSWTPGQVAEHIIKSLSGFPRILKGNTGITQRRHDEKLVAIDTMFSNYTKKLTSPEFLVPAGSEYKQETLLKSLEEREAEAVKIIGTYDLSATCLDFELPTFGQLTGFEWASFYLIHTQRHIYQLKNIYQRINN
jgi:hypothetical protein